MVRGPALGLSAATATILIGILCGSAAAQTKIKAPTSGFPIKISKSGSYIVDANLIASAKNVNILNVTASDVTIDLNGFRVGGPGSGGTGIGVNAAGMANVTIENGSVSGMGGDGIRLGDNGVVRNVQVNNNGGNGINCQASGCLVTGCTANSNSLSGLRFNDGTSGFNEDVMNGNGIPFTNGFDLGNNVCNGTTC